MISGDSLGECISRKYAFSANVLMVTPVLTCVLLLWLLCRAVLSDGPQQDLLLDASGDHVTKPHSERSTSSEEEVDDSASSCTVLCAPVSTDEKEDWDVL